MRTESSALREDRKLVSLIDELESNQNDLRTIRDGVEAQLNKETREKLDKEIDLNDEARKEVREEIIKAALERSTAELGRQKVDEELDRVRVDRKVAQEEREAVKKERLTNEKERQNASEQRLLDKAWNKDTRIESFLAQIRANNEINSAFKDSILTERYPGTCKWIFDNNKFKAWTGDSSDTPILWLTRKHGAGKSFIYASVIEYVSSRP